jgi:tetratricopeptide (TPR) repeat protein
VRDKRDTRLRLTGPFGPGWRRVVVALCCVIVVTAVISPALTQELTGLVTARKAANALAKGQLDEAVRLYTEALKDNKLTNDRKGVIHADRGVIYARLGQPDLAIADFNRAVTLFPEYAAAYNNRGAFLVSLGAFDEAIKDFDRALVLAPGYVAALNNRAAAHAKLKRNMRAIADYTRAIRLAPGLAEPLAGRAQIYLVLNRPYAAMRDLDRALQNNARFALGYRARAQARTALEMYSEAAQDLSRAITFDPADATAYLLRARAYLKAKDLEAARKDYTKVIELEPRSGEAYRERGNVNILLDDLESADQDFARAIELEPRNPETFAYRALLYKKRDQAELGMQEIAKALKVGAGNAITQWAKGEIEEALSMIPEAAESYRKALEIDSGLTMAQFGLKRLGQEPPSDVLQFPALGRDGWQVRQQAGRFFAVNGDIPKLRVPLEMAGPGRPKILDWKMRTGALKDFGLLHFDAGNVPLEGGGHAPLEYVALIDTRHAKFVALEPHRHGNAVSKWEWQPGQVTVEAIDGLTDIHILRQVARPTTVATGPAQHRRQRRSTVYDDNGTPAWAPWADPSARRRARRSTQNRRRRPRTLFDLILGN